METYKEAKEAFVALRKRLTLYDVLHDCGVPYSMVHYYETPNITSGYTMGEEIVVKCNGWRLDAIDGRRWYAKTCRWIPKHGYICINFTKKSLRRYLEILKFINDENGKLPSKERAALLDEYRAIILKSIDKESSVIIENKCY